MCETNPLSHVFFITARGYAADHWYAWIVKALNAHPDMLAYLANEGSRPKYFSERTRSERPDIQRFAHFLADVGMTYTAIGDCYSYRADMMHKLDAVRDGMIPVANIVRHPYVWLQFYIRWRTRNMRMPNGETGPLDHEWSNCEHDLYRDLGLRTFTRDEVEVWACYLGMRYLNNVLSDTDSGIRQYRLEDLVSEPERFADLVSYLTHGRVQYEDTLLHNVYSWIWQPFRGEPRLRCTPDAEYSSWPEWKRIAMTRLLSTEAKERYREFGYKLHD